MTARNGAIGPIGEVIAGKYRIEQVLGAGGMGVVYAARHVDLHELYAIKVMRPTQDEEQGTADERFLREARACARLRGEHVARVHDVGRLEDGTPYMVMEHLIGTDLRKLVKQRGAMPMADVVEYVIQACDAIAEAHAAGIVHRDLKPANLFLAERPGAPPIIKVLDFGISKQLGSGKGLDVTNTTDMLGSPFYMAPEQMRSGRSADARSDIWSLGVVLYELGGGALPFSGNSITEVCARVLQDRPPALMPRVPGLSPGFDAVVMRCLEKEPEARFQSAGELAAALRSIRAAGALAPGLVAQRSTLPGAHEPAMDTGRRASWGTTTAAAPRSGWSGLRIGLVAVACTAAGALGVAAIGALRGPDSGPAAPAPSAEVGPPAAAVTAANMASATAAPINTIAPSAAPLNQIAAPLNQGAAASDSEAPSGSSAPSASASSKGKAPPVVRTAAPRPPKVVDFGDRQ